MVVCLHLADGLKSESKNHINYLELLASFHALQCFVSNLRSFMLDLQLTTQLQWPILIIWGVYDPAY